MEMKFYQCEICGQIVAIVHETAAPLVCCGKPMKEMVPGSIDASHEKHVPVIEVDGNKVWVTVGSAPHPMMPEHYIEWISLRTQTGNQRKELKPGMEPRVCFRICDGDEVLGAFAFCNLHGLWEA